MKTIAFLFVLFLGLSGIGQAQAVLNVNIGLQPVWGPVGYDHVDYYYLPDVEAYYYVPEHRFYYQEGGVWVNGPALPGRYPNFDLFRAHKIVINEPTPYLRHAVYRDKYSSFRGHQGQPVIRDSHDSRYWEIKEHPEHGKWKGNEGKHKGEGKHEDHDNNGEHRGEGHH
ncbi:MAG TPA: hypothetical protein VNZ86_08565 [Bacteroidia bacterium]|nr:hypothetical protein [Bacteroidia bacterium]